MYSILVFFFQFFLLTKILYINAIVKKKPEFSTTIHPTSILLFRYSALTFNSHMIHYDQDYARNIEKHPSKKLFFDFPFK